MKLHDTVISLQTAIDVLTNGHTDTDGMIFPVETASVDDTLCWLLRDLRDNTDTWVVTFPCGPGCEWTGRLAREEDVQEAESEEWNWSKPADRYPPKETR
jgi:hypothetical protein